MNLKEANKILLKSEFKIAQDEKKEYITYQKITRL